MISFRRRRPADPGAAVEAFWSWWRTAGAAATATAVEAGRAIEIAEDLGRRVSAVDPRLGWELGAGDGSRHVLMVTAEGDPALRAAARRWLRGAPDADDRWEYSDVRRAAPNLADISLELQGAVVPADEVLVEAEVGDVAVDVGVYHPALAPLEAGDRLRAVFLLLDQALGEVDVELWLGTVEALRLPPPEPVPLTSLPGVVDEVRRRWTGDDGRPAWALAEGTAPDGRPLLATVQVPLSPATAPHLDTHVAVSVPFAHRTDAGLPDDASLEPLRRFEDHLAERLGDSGQVVAHRTHDGVRVLHFYVDGTTPAAEQVRAAVGGWDQGKVRVRVETDPGWDAVDDLRP
jgi:hypothetical protein